MRAFLPIAVLAVALAGCTGDRPQPPSAALMQPCPPPPPIPACDDELDCRATYYGESRKAHAECIAKARALQAYASIVSVRP